MAINRETLDQLLSRRDPKEVFSKDGLFDELKKALAERVLNAEMSGIGRGGEVVGCVQLCLLARGRAAPSPEAAPMPCRSRSLSGQPTISFLAFRRRAGSLDSR